MSKNVASILYILLLLSASHMSGFFARRIDRGGSLSDKGSSEYIVCTEDVKRSRDDAGS